jgi:hypothetical protein
MIEFPFETGNSIEINLALFLREYFPNYEGFRSKYLVPLTGYPRNKNWRRDTHPDLERIGIAAFGLLKSLNFILIKKEKISVSGHPDQNFKNIYFHFGLSADCIDSLLRSIVIIESYLKIINLDLKLKIPDDELIRKFTNWVETEYSKRFEELIQDGRPILYYPQSDRSFIKLVVKYKEIRNSYLDIVKELKDYRNFFVHNPGVDVFKDTVYNKLYAIKKSEVKRTKNWASLSYLYSLDNSMFIDPSSMVNDDLTKFAQSLNSIWPSVNESLDLIYEHPDFPKLFKHFYRRYL